MEGKKNLFLLVVIFSKLRAEILFLGLPSEFFVPGIEEPSYATGCAESWITFWQNALPGTVALYLALESEVEVTAI